MFFDFQILSGNCIFLKECSVHTLLTDWYPVFLTDTIEIVYIISFAKIFWFDIYHLNIWTLTVNQWKKAYQKFGLGLKQEVSQML